jgi:hypothetical protein
LTLWQLIQVRTRSEVLANRCKLRARPLLESEIKAKTHQRLGFALTVTAALGGGVLLVLFFNEFGKSLGSIMSRAYEYASNHMHPLIVYALYIAVDWGGPLAFFVVPAFLARRVYDALVPARCAKCGDRAYRERAPFATYLRQGGEWVTYLCRSCGHRESTTWEK